MEKEFLTWEQIICRGFEEVIVESYGYDEVHVYGSHYEPFSHKRSFTFIVGGPWDEETNSLIHDPERCYLGHKWLNLSDSEKDLQFELREDGKVYLDDPDLWSK